MDYNRYYNTLGLSSSASAEEIKRAYRRLAAKYHPDINPNGEQTFIEIKEAYEILTNKKTITYSSVTVTPQTKTTAQRKSQTKEERIRAAKQKYYEDKRKEEAENLRFYNNLINGKKFQLFKYSAWFCFFFAILLILDESLPYRSANNKIHQEEIPAYIQEMVVDLVEKSKTDDDMQHINWDNVEIESNYTEQKTYIFGKDRFLKINYKNDASTDEIEAQTTIWALILLFLLPMFTLIYKRMNVTFIFLFYGSLYIAIPIALVAGLVHLYLLFFE